jgi:hypothetical protein
LKKRDLHLLVAIVENSLISDLQQCVQDSAARLEDFIEGKQFGLDQLPAVMRLYSSRLSPETDTGPKSSSGVVKRVIRYAKLRNPRAVLRAGHGDHPFAHMRAAYILFVLRHGDGSQVG